jgi:hypothetical protein
MAKAPAKRATHVYTDDEIRELTSDGYIVVIAGLWDYIPRGAHIRYQKRDDGSGKQRGVLFKPGGFVRAHIDSKGKAMIIENKLNGKAGDPGYMSWPVAYDSIEILWKKYDYSAFVEIHLIYGSLAQKKQEVEELTARVTRLENILRSLVQ